jgi:uncharacterized protein
MVSAAPDGVLIRVHVTPRAGRSELAGTRDDGLLVRVNAAPVEGAANAELIRILAEAIAVPKRAISVAAGEREDGGRRFTSAG